MNSKHLTNGTFLILIGALLLGSNLGIIPAINWVNLLQYWPMLLVIAGLQLLFPRGILGLLAPIVLVLTVTVAVLGYTPSDAAQRWWGDYGRQEITAAVVEPTALLNMTDLAFVNIDIGVDNQLPEGTIAVEAHENLIAPIQITNLTERNRYTIHRTKDRRLHTAINHLTAQPISIQLSSQELWDLNLNTGILTGTLNLTDLSWQKTTIDTGISNLKIYISNNTTTQEISVHSGISMLNLILTRGTNIRITSDGLVSSTRLIKQGFARDGDLYTSPGFSPAQPFIDFQLESGLGIINVDWI